MTAKGTLYWITGLAGAGKTTIGSQLYYELKEQEKNVVILDGDILKKIVGKNVGYEREDRLQRAYQYCSLCQLLTNQGIDVVICTIAMFDEIRDWNRKNISNYLEVFLDVDYEVLRKRNKKGLYAKSGKNVVGVDMETEFPKEPDLVINSDGSIPVKDCVAMILRAKVRNKILFNDDTAYWNQYYNSTNHIKVEPSKFAQDVLAEYITDTNKSLIDLGCGNGRDSLYFASQGLQVIGIDASDVAIAQLRKDVDMHNALFICDDFVNSSILYQNEVDYVYSRFTMHAITKESERKVLENAYNVLKTGGILFVEARSVNDSIFGIGKQVEENAFIHDGHYRRFINLDEFAASCKEVGFKVIYAEEGDEYAPLGSQKPACIRVIAVKTRLKGQKVQML